MSRAAFLRVFAAFALLAVLTAALVLPNVGSAPPVAAFTFHTDGALTVNLDATGTKYGSRPLDYAWDFGDGSTGTGVTASHTYPIGGARPVTLTVTDQVSETSSTSSLITTSTPEPVWPNADNTGVITTHLTTLSTTSPRPYPADVVSGDRLLVNTPNAVYEGWRFDRLVEVHAPNVTFRNCSFEGVNGNPGSAALLNVANDRDGTNRVPSALVEDSRLIPAFPNNTIDGFRGSNATLRRVEISATVDGAHIYGSTDFSDPFAGNVLIEHSWIHDLTWYDDDSHSDGTHNDGIQVVGGSNIQLVGSRIDGTLSNSALQVTADRNRVTGLVLRENLLSGGGCTVNIADDGTASGAITGTTFTANAFVKGSTRRLDCAILVGSGSLPTVSASRNRWRDDSLPPPEPSSDVPPLA